MMAAYDALCVMGIFEGRMERLQLLAPFALVEMPTIPVLVELQCTGFVVEKKPFQALKNDVEKLLNDLNRLAIDEGVPPDYREQMEQSGTKRENGGMSSRVAQVPEGARGAPLGPPFPLRRVLRNEKDARRRRWPEANFDGKGDAADAPELPPRAAQGVEGEPEKAAEARNARGETRTKPPPLPRTAVVRRRAAAAAWVERRGPR